VLDAAETKNKDYVIWVDELPGFGLRVFKSGKRSYVLPVSFLWPLSSLHERRVHRQILSALPGVQRLVTQFTIRTLATGDND
jgi:hypothetical protein